jgi:hypothetical protein
MAGQLITTIKLSHDDYKNAVKFAMKLWYAGKPKGDWRSTGTKRDIGKYITDHSMGKLAEIGFAKFLKVNWGIGAKLDFHIHPGTLSIDSGDLVEINWKGKNIRPQISIDVKSTKSGSLLAMVDLHEFNNRKYDAYAWVKVDLPLNHLARPIFEAVRNGNVEEIEALIPSLEDVNAEVIGFAYRNDVDKWAEIKKGDPVVDPNSQRRLFIAKTDNKTCPISQLRSPESDWNELIERVCGVKNAR